MYTFLLATTTTYGTQNADSLIAAGFRCLGVITPTPRPVGRHQILTPNPAHLWAEQHNFPLFPVTNRLEKSLQESLPTVDFLLVVDFGYYVPGWLIKHPRLLSVNIHPSLLPRWRGASPGQAVILNGETQSAVSIMTLAAQMDAGDLLTQIPFAVDPHWTTQDYYDYAFSLAASTLPKVLTQYAQGELQLQPQSGKPTLAPKISKDDAFIDYADLTNPALAVQIERQIRAYQPWPIAWTLVTTAKGQTRLQLLQAHLDSQGQLIIDQAKLAGDTAKPWSQILPKIQS